MGDKKVISGSEYNDFQGKFGIENLKSLDSNGKKVQISELEKNALECIVNAGMFVQDGEEYIVNEKLYAMYFVIHHFMETTSSLDAFDIYCAYSASYLYNDEGDQLENMMNFVASYENGAARLVQSHRDHYVHSAYVFILGLAIFNTQEEFRTAFRDNYKLKDGSECYEKFIKLWGLTALFHDIGYQYEIPFNQIRENNKFLSAVKNEFHYVYFQYKNMDQYTDLENIIQLHGLSTKNAATYKKESVEKNVKALVEKTFTPKDIEDVLAYHMTRKFESRGLDRDEIAMKLRNKNTPTELGPKEKTYEVYMDHAYYSGIRLFRQMFNIFGLKFQSNLENLSLRELMDAITAITMHNKFFEYELSNKKHMKMDEHPLAYLLILCDELQCWDRTSFGRSSVKEFHPIDCQFEFKDDGKIIANYIFDEKNDAITFKNGKIVDVVKGPLEKFIRNKDKEYIDVINKNATQKWDKNEDKNINNCTTWRISSTDFPSGDNCRFLYSINKIVDCSNVEVKASFEKSDNKYCREYLTILGMDDIYQLAKETYERMYNNKDDYEKGKIKNKFDDSERNVQDKLHDIMMIKVIGEMLNQIHCFSLKDQKAFERKNNFEEKEKDQMNTIMMKSNIRFLAENRIVVGKAKCDKILNDLESFSRERVDSVLEALLNYPGLEVYKI